MSKLSLDGAGKLGIIKDIQPHELTPLGWSDGSNIKFRDGKIVRMNGAAQIFGTPLAAPYWLKGVFSPTDAFWLYSSLSKLYATDGASHTDVSRITGNYSVDDRRLWNGGVLANIPVITNGVDVPQMWLGAGLGTRLADLSNWDGGDRVNVIKPYKNFLVGGALTRGGQLFPHVVKWSHPAVPGSVPISWDPADPTLQTGEVEIADGKQGQIRDALELRDTLIIYKDNTTWGMQFTGGQSVFRHYPILTQSGILSNDCVVDILNGAEHCVATGDDIILFDGQNVRSILTKRMRQFLSNDIEQSTADRSYMVHEQAEKCVWFFYPTIGFGFPNKALIYNYEDDTITFRDFTSEVRYATSGTIGAVGEVWDDNTGTWDSDTSVWDAIGYNTHFFSMVGCKDGVIEDLGGNSLFAVAYLERQGLAIVGQDRLTGELKTDITQRTLITRIWPKVRNGPVKITLGSQEDLGGPIVWQPQQTFTPVTQKFLDFTTAGRLQAIRFDWDVSSLSCEIDGYDLEVNLLGAF